MSRTTRTRKRTKGGGGVYLRRRLLVALALVVVVLGLTLAGFRLARDGSLPGIRVAGADVGGLNEEDLRDELADLARDREEGRFTVIRRGGDGIDRVKRSYLRRAAGYSFDVSATAERVLERGRQSNPILALIDHVSATIGRIDVEPVEEIDDERLEEWTTKVQDRFAVEPREGDLRFRRGEVVPVEPRRGVVIDPERLRGALRGTLSKTGRPHVALPLERVQPETTPEEVAEVAARARRVLAKPVELVRGPRAIELPPVLIGRALDVERDGSDLALRVDADALDDAAGGRFARLESDPQDASFALVSGEVRVVPAEPGFAVDRERLAERLLDIAASKDRSAPAPVERSQPDLTTKEARDLDIDERVSSFTTAHSCCEPRVENIHRIADLLDGTVVMPGETFSVNDAVGPRTRAKGFVPAPAIYEGEYVEEVGGGISQFATTMFNAIFFGGYDFVEYKAHSYYISRYPMGREATLSYPAVDLAFNNDSDAGIYVDTSYTDTTITVTFYGSTDREVRASSGDPHNYTKPQTRCEQNKSLGRGEKRVIQEGSRGFDIVVKRIFGSGETEDFFTRYLPEPRIVERRSC